MTGSCRNLFTVARTDAAFAIISKSDFGLFYLYKHDEPERCEMFVKHVLDPAEMVHISWKFFNDNLYLMLMKVTSTYSSKD